jgi:predicted ABC-type exoprotein transport system permease subunit
MEVRKIISSLCYFSVFFAPFLFPIVVYFVADEHDMKKHAKASFLSHVVPALTFLLFFIVFIPGMPLSGEIIVGWLFLIMILFCLLSFIIAVWNVVKGIKVLMS